jgi:hypothetical protein
MKKSLFMMAALAIVALTSCQEQVQSQLDFETLTDKAVVQGYVYINKGYVKDGSNYVVKDLPAAGCEVLVKVPYTKYDADASAGDKLFEAVCDDNGFYSIEVPVGQAAISGATVHTRPFTDKYYDLVNGNILEKEVSYNEVSTTVEIERGKTYTAANLIVKKGTEGAIMSRNQSISIKGTVKERYEVRDSNDDVSADTRNANKVSVVITITNSEYANEKLVFNTTTSYGSYTLNAKVYDTWAINKTTVQVETKAYKSYVTHYYERKYSGRYWYPESQSVSGIYKSASTSQTLSENDLLLGVYIKDIVLTFAPDYNNNTIYGIGQSGVDYVDGVYTYDSTNPLNW